MKPRPKTVDADEEGRSEAKKNVSEPQVQEEAKESLSSGDDTVSENESAKSGADGAHSGIEIPGRKPTRFRMVLLLTMTLCIFLAAAGFLLVKFTVGQVSFGKSFRKLEPVTGIMRPIPLPDYREMLDFLLVYEVGGQRMITAIRVEIAYQSPTRYQYFKEQNVAFRDTVYAFLLGQNLSGNSAKSWHSVLEKDLLDFLRVKLPQNFPDKIVLTQIENL
jgi:hypothetical protein